MDSPFFFQEGIHPYTKAMTLAVRPYDYWNGQQDIAATAFLFLLRDYVALSGELPSSINELPFRKANTDPISNEPWKYHRVSAKRATLNLISYELGVRKRFELLIE